MRRREFIKATGGALAAWPLAVRAQQPQPLIGYISGRSEQSDAPFVTAFRAGLGQTGGAATGAKIEFRYADNQSSRLEALARDLIQLKQSCRALELRSATSLARLLHQIGRTDEARDVLTPVYSAFSEGLDRPDSKAARVVLSALG